MIPVSTRFSLGSKAATGPMRQKVFVTGQEAGMRCIVINLPDSLIRRKAIDEQFQRAGLPYERWQATSVDRLTSRDRESVMQEIRASQAMRPLQDPELACLLSHMGVLRSLASGEDDMAAVFEDDAVLSPELPKFLEQLVGNADKFDVVMLERRTSSIPYVPIYDVQPAHTIGRLRYSDFGACGYVITRHAAGHILQRFPRPVHEIDRILPRFWVNGLDRVFWADPALVHHNVALPSEIKSARDRGRVAYRARLLHNPLFALRRFPVMAKQNFVRRQSWLRLRRQDRATAGCRRVEL